MRSFATLVFLLYSPAYQREAGHWAYQDKHNSNLNAREKKKRCGKTGWDRVNNIGYLINVNWIQWTVTTTEKVHWGGLIIPINEWRRHDSQNKHMKEEWLGWGEGEHWESCSWMEIGWDC